MSLAVPLDGGLEQVQSPQDVASAADVHDSRIQAHKLCFEYAFEIQPLVAAAETQGILRAYVFPSDCLGVLQHWVLNRRPLAHRAWCSPISGTAESRLLISSSSMASYSSTKKAASPSRANIFASQAFSAEAIWLCSSSKGIGTGIVPSCSRFILGIPVLI